MRQLFQGQPDVMSAKKTEHFKQLLETRIAELERVLTSAEGETRIGTPRHADPADQAASEYERQSLVDKAAAARQMTQTRGPREAALRHDDLAECEVLQDEASERVKKRRRP
jgi:RNA polymerase-binding transcription factor DksA